MDEYETSCEPMDIDVSNSTNAMDISYTEDVKYLCPRNLKTEINSFHNSIENDDKDTLQKTSIKNNTSEDPVQDTSQLYRNAILVFLIVSAVSIISSNIFSIKCYEDLDLVTIKNTLDNRLYGQTIAIENVIDFFNSQENAKVLVLYGGTGVGKTFLTSLLIENLLNSTNMYHYSMSNLKKIFSPESMVGITLCKSSMVVIDDISIDDKEITKYAMELIEKSLNLKRNITIVLIYNCANINQQFLSNCPKNFLPELKLLLNNINVSQKIVNFQPLTEDSLKKCIQYEFRHKKLNDTALNDIMRHFNVQRDGCKGVHQKTKYLNVL